MIGPERVVIFAARINTEDNNNVLEACREATKGQHSLWASYDPKEVPVRFEHLRQCLSDEPEDRRTVAERVRAQIAEQPRYQATK